MKYKKAWSFFFLSALPLLPVPGHAVTTSQLPGSTLPGVVSRQLSKEFDQTAAPTKKLSAMTSPEAQKAVTTPAPGSEIVFLLSNIVIEGNTAYTEKVLSDIYRDSVGKKITVAKLQEIVQSLTRFYRNNGYVLSRAILPPQKVVNGIVHIKIIEGYIDHVIMAGKAGTGGKIVAAYGRRAAKTRPLQLKTLEYYLHLANEVPGISTKAVLIPSNETVGASDLQLVTTRKPITGFLSYNNFGTRYIGPQQLALSLAANSILRSGDSAKVTFSTVPGRPKMLHFFDVSYSFLLGTSGLELVLGKNASVTKPQFLLSPIGIQGNATTYYINTQYPLIRSREQNLTLEGSFTYLDSKTASLGNLLYNDHLRTLSLGGSWSFAGRLQSTNQLDARLVKGLPLFGATTETDSVTTSRFGGHGDFTSLEASASRIQPITGRYSFSLSVNGQYSLESLLSSEQYTWGGSQMGRGYDPAELIGDRGVGGSAELRAAFQPNLSLFKSIEPFLFYDQGVIWNIQAISGIKQKQSAASAGAGARLVFSSHVSGQVFMAQPITKMVSGLESLGRGRSPRYFFGLIFMV